MRKYLIGLVITISLFIMAAQASAADYYSRSYHTATAGQTAFIVDFADGLIDVGSNPDTIQVYVNDVLEPAASVTWTSSTTLELSGYVCQADDEIQFRRVTHKDDLLVDFTDGTRIRTTTLDRDLRQLLHAVHEAVDVTVNVQDIEDNANAAAASAEEAASSAALTSYHKLGTLAELQAYTGTADLIYVEGRTSPGDGYQGKFKKITGVDYSAEVAADTQHGVYVPLSGGDGSGGAWVRIIRSGITPGMFGAVGDGSTDDSTGFQAMFDFFITHRYSIDLEGKRYRLDSLITCIRTGDSNTTYPEDWVINGNGAYLDFSNTTETTGALLTVGGVEATGVGMHDTGFIKMRDFVIYGPESSNPAGITSPSPDTSLTGLYLIRALNIHCENIRVMRCYKGIHTKWMFPGYFTHCYFDQNYIGAHIDETCTVAKWDGCGFTEASYGLLIMPSSATGQVLNQSFYTPRFENLLAAIVIDPGTRASGFGVSGVTISDGYFETIEYDMARFGKEWTFATPTVRGTDRTADVQEVTFRDGYNRGAWNGAGGFYVPFVFNSSGLCKYFDISGYFDISTDFVYRPTKSKFTFLGDDGNIECLGPGDGWVVFRGSDAAVFGQGGNINTVTRTSTGAYTITFVESYASGQTMVLTASAQDAYVVTLSGTNETIAYIRVLDYSTLTAVDSSFIRINISGPL